MAGYTSNEPTVEDVINAIEKLKKFAQFGSELLKAVSALSGIGIDISRINPYNLNDLIRMILNMGKSNLAEDIDIEALKDGYSDIMSMKLSEVREMCNTIRRFVYSYSDVVGVISLIASRSRVGRDELDLIKGLFGIRTERREETASSVEIEELTQDEIDMIRDMIKRKT